MGLDFNISVLFHIHTFVWQQLYINWLIIQTLNTDTEKKTSCSGLNGACVKFGKITFIFKLFRLRNWTCPPASTPRIYWCNNKFAYYVPSSQKTCWAVLSWHTDNRQQMCWTWMSPRPGRARPEGSIKVVVVLISGHFCPSSGPKSQHRGRQRENVGYF